MFKYRTLTTFLGLTLLFPITSNALSLGEIQVKSSFAQPFFAEIDIPSYTSDELESLKVTLADPEKFATMGLETPSYLKTFFFQVELKPNGKPFIKVFTLKPLKELSISYVIEASWLGGKIIKDYHILLTPEAITELREEQLMHEQLAEIDTAVVGVEDAETTATATTEPAVPKKTAPSTVAALNPGPTPAARDQSARAKKQRRAPTAPPTSKIKSFGTNGAQYASVERGQTLSQIAREMRNDESVSINQVMVSLYEQNLEAFVDNNINLLKAGSTLTIKDINDFKKKTRREALLLAQQYLNNNQTAENTATSVAAATPQDSVMPAPNQGQGARLEIASTADEANSPEALEKLKQEQIASTEEELKFAQELASVIQLENQELQDRIAVLEARMDEIALRLIQVDGQVPTSAPQETSGSQQTDNLVVTSTNFALPEDRKIPLMQKIEKHQTAIAIGAISLLLLVLLLARKKEQIKEMFTNLKGD